MGTGRIALAIAVAVSALGTAWFARCERPATGAAFADRPFALQERRLPLLDVDGSWLAELERRLMPGHESAFPKTGSGLLHALRLFGVGGAFPSSELPDGTALVRALTDNRAAESVFGAPVLRRTRYGLRYAELEILPALQTGNQESHLDQTLATFGELGLPLSFAVHAGDEPSSLADVLRDMLAYYDVAAHEFEWTAMAICLYLPPATSWVDRFGERTEFDDLAERVVETDPSKSPCAGTHLLQVLNALIQADERHRVLSSSVRDRVRSRLCAMVEAAVRTQREDGGFDPHWWAIASGRIARHGEWLALEEDLLATGHLVECFLKLPEDVRPDASVLARAGEHLAELLKSVAPDVEFLREHYCPVVHALCAVRRLKRELPLPCAPDGPERDSATVLDKG